MSSSARPVGSSSATPFGSRWGFLSFRSFQIQKAKPAITATTTTGPTTAPAIQAWFVFAPGVELGLELGLVVVADAEDALLVIKLELVLGNAVIVLEAAVITTPPCTLGGWDDPEEFFAAFA
jgi:hypothetical protein